MRLALKPSILGLAMVAVLAVAAAALWGSIDGPAMTSAQQAASVSATEFQFSPRTQTVAVGTTVTWRNNGAESHTMTSDTGLFSSGTIISGGQFTFTFNQAGSFNYHCQFHGGPGSGMIGTIVVAAQATATPTATTTIAPTATVAPTATASPTTTVVPTATAAPTGTAAPAPAAAAPRPAAALPRTGEGESIQDGGPSTGASLPLAAGGAVLIAAGALVSRRLRARR